MRRILVTAAAALAVLGTMPAPPATAADQTVVVNGYAFPSGLRYVAGACSGNGKATPYAAYRQGSILGDHAIGLAFGGQTGGMGGVAAWVPDPGNLQDASLATYHPGPLPGGSGVDGHIVIQLDVFGDGFQSAWLEGRYDVSNLSGWHPGDDVADIPTDWYWSDDATREYTGWTLPEVADDWGPGSGGAWLNFEFGCRGRDFYFDDLRLATAAGATTYDFEVLVDSPAFVAVAPGEDPPARGAEPGEATVGRVSFTPDQKRLVVALCEPFLRRTAPGAAAIPSSAEAADRLGWTLTRFNRKLDNVCQKLADAGIRGLHGGVGKLASNRKARLVEHALSTKIVTKDDLALLDA